MSDSDVAERVCKVLEFMSTVNFSLATFMHALSWGDGNCFNDPKIRYARSSFLKSELLPQILHRWWKPLRTPGSHNKRPTGATTAMETFASMCLQEVCAEELDNLSEFFISPAGDDITEEELTSTTFTEE